MNAREQYRISYRECRINQRVGGNFNKPMTDSMRRATHNASKSYFAKKHGRDTIETMQIRLTNAKKRAEIRRRNALIMATKFAWTF